MGNNTTVNVGSQNLVTNNYEPRTGKLLDTTYGNGQTVAYGYDSADRVVNILDRFKYGYDASGNVANHEDLVNGVNYKYTYDMSDRLAKIVDSKGNTVKYDYNVKINSRSISENLNGLDYTTSYIYDKENKPQTTTYKDTVITNNYDSLGRLENKVTKIGNIQFNTIYEFEAGKGASDTIKSTTNRVGKITNKGKAIDYSYDKNGNIATITENGKVIKYFYNELNELISEEYYDSQVLNKTITYSYDNGGNILNKVETIAGGSPTTTSTYTYSDANWKDKLTSFNGKTIEYKQDTSGKDISMGNPEKYDGWTFSWELGRQLAGMTGNGKTITYKYNDSGIRTQKTVNGVTTNYHLVGDKVTFETNGTDNIYYTYDGSDTLVSMNLNGVEYYYIRNAQGDIIGLHDINGAEVVNYSYDTWGKLISIKDASGKDVTNDITHVGNKNPYRYRGYRYDTDTGLYYLQSRYYNADWGRFINADAIAGNVGELLGHNIFAYCKNNAVNMEDTSGYGSVTMNPSMDLRGIVTFIVVCLLVPTVAKTPYITTSSTKTKTNAIPISIPITKNDPNKPKPKYWIANYNAKTKKIEFGPAISEEAAYLRVLNKQSIMCVNNKAAELIALKFPGEHKWEYDKGKYGVPGYYPHYHTNWAHGDPHIWFYPTLQ